jgi:hypothetical protein
VDLYTFDLHLRTATIRAIDFARQYVNQDLPDDAAYLVYPGQSYDGNARVGDEVVFPSEELPPRQYHGPWSHEEAITFLWREGKIPEWIDVAVQYANSRYTELSLLCCGRFTAQDDLLYYRYPGGMPPFGIKSPNLPAGWVSAEVSDKFDLPARN